MDDEPELVIACINENKDWIIYSFLDGKMERNVIYGVPLKDRVSKRFYNRKFFNEGYELNADVETILRFLSR